MSALSVSKLRSKVNKALLDWLSPLGFVPADSGGVERWTGERYDYIGCVVNRIGGENRVSPFGQMGFASTQVLYSHFMSDAPEESNKIAVDVQMEYADFMKDFTAALRCQSTDDFDSFLSDLKAFVMNRLYPALMACATPQQVFALYLKKDENDRRSFDPPSWFGLSSALTGLILARLYAPERYDAMKTRYQPQFDGVGAIKLERAKRLMAYLDQPDPLPLLARAMEDEGNASAQRVLSASHHAPSR
jgi:hypothetical protein